MSRSRCDTFAYRLVGSIRAKHPDIPIHVHSHDTAGISTANMIAAAAAGADVVMFTIDSKYFDLSLEGLTCTLLGMSNLTSPCHMGAVTSALEQTGHGTGIRYADIQALNLCLDAVRMLYTCFEANVRASDSSVFAQDAGNDLRT